MCLVKCALPIAIVPVLLASPARVALATVVLCEPAEWNFGVRPQHCLVAKTIRLRPEVGERARISSVSSTCRSLRTRTVRESATADSPAEIELVLDTGAKSGRVGWSLFVTFDASAENAVRLPIHGWIRGRQGPWRAEVFYLESQASGRRFLRWWRSAGAGAAGADGVQLLPVGEVANYRRLRELERKASSTCRPADVTAFIDGEIVLCGVDEVTTGLTGLLNLENDGRPGQSRPPATEEPLRLAVPSTTEGLLEVWFFYFAECRNCKEARQAVQELARSLAGKAEVRIYDASADPESIALALATLAVYPDAPKMVPSAVAFVGDELLLGTAEVISYSAGTAEKQLERGGEHLQVRRPDEIIPLADRTETLAFLPVVLAALADGVNPCAFAAMVLLMSVLATARFSAEAPGLQRRMLLLGGGAFCLGIFVTYYLAGLGLFMGARRLEGFPVAEAIVFWSVWSLAVAGGVLSLVDAVGYLRTGDSERVVLKVPEFLRRRFTPLMRGRFSRYGLLFGGLSAGVLIAVLEGICTGQMYLPTIQYMARTPGLRGKGAAFLFVYNALFILPLAVILGVALAGIHFQRLSTFLRRHLGGTKLLLAAVFFILAVAMVLGR